MTNFMAMSDFCNLGFQVFVKMMDFLEIIASCDLKFCLYDKLNAYIMHNYQVSVYRTIGPLVACAKDYA